MGFTISKTINRHGWLHINSTFTCGQGPKSFFSIYLNRTLGVVHQFLIIRTSIMYKELPNLGIVHDHWSVSRYSHSSFALIYCCLKKQSGWVQRTWTPMQRKGSHLIGGQWQHSRGSVSSSSMVGDRSSEPDPHYGCQFQFLSGKCSELVLVPPGSR